MSSNTITNALESVTKTGTNQTTNTTSIGKDAFMQLLVAQLKYQNPLDPMEGTDFAAQLAQFSSLEQLSNINNAIETQSVNQVTLNYAQCVNMIGKEVVVSSDDGSTTTTGTVTAVHFRNNAILATVNGNEVPISSITEVRNAETT
jgi:flagellar basal-body rod modification protein FlgD